MRLLGLVWSFAGTTLLPMVDPFRQALCVEVLTGIVAIGFLSLAMMASAFALFASAIIVPATWAPLSLDPWPQSLAALLFLVFLVVMILGPVRVDRLTRRQLRTANETKLRFLSHQSHELHTPLTVILGSSDRLLHDPRERQRPETLEQVRSAGAPAR
ncbi:MAG: HAMP domain-containing histidine kinase [Gammaproteobacteria bacterium]|nr:HAMP domain-containing histidine kinase [Gammaproteobacteria bacterium]